MRKLEAISHFGNATNLAKALGINSSAVYQWPDEVPRLRAFEIERITNGELKAGFTPASPQSVQQTQSVSQ